MPIMSLDPIEALLRERANVAVGQNQLPLLPIQATDEDLEQQRFDRGVNRQTAEQPLGPIPDFATGTAPGRPAQNEMQETIMRARGNLDQLDRIMQTYDADMLTFGSRFSNIIDMGVDRFNPSAMSPEDRNRLRQNTRMRASASELMNREINRLAGSAVSASEAGRILRSVPNPGSAINPFSGDSPTEFETKVRVYRENMMLIMGRASLWQAAGGIGTPYDFMNLDQARREIERQGNQIQQQIMQQNPNMSSQEARIEAAEQLRESLGF